MRGPETHRDFRLSPLLLSSHTSVTCMFGGDPFGETYTSFSKWGKGGVEGAVQPRSWRCCHEARDRVACVGLGACSIRHSCYFTICISYFGPCPPLKPPAPSTPHRFRPFACLPPSIPPSIAPTPSLTLCPPALAVLSCFRHILPHSTPGTQSSTASSLEVAPPPSSPR